MALNGHSNGNGSVTAEEVRRHEERIDSTLRSVYVKRKGSYEAITHRTPLDELIANEDGMLDSWGERNETFHRLLDYFFMDGPHPGCVLRRVYALAKALRSDLVMHMSVRDLGLMLDETGAAQSWRVKQIFSGYLKAAGNRGFKAGFQKTETACEEYRRDRQGNQNRRRGAVLLQCLGCAAKWRALEFLPCRKCGATAVKMLLNKRKTMNGAKK